MAGLLDWINTPEGVGLLSAVAGGMAGARKGTPWNNAGRAGLAGVAGYQGAQEQLRADDAKAFENKYKSLQMQQLEQTLARQKGEQTWKAGLPAVMAPKLTGSTEQGQQLAEQNAAFGQEGLPALAESAQYAQPDAPLNMNYGVDKQAMQDYLMQPESPYADELVKQKIMPSTEKPQLVTVYGDDGKPMQKWLRPGEAEGVAVGGGKPEGESYKERTVSPDGQTYIKQSSNDGGKTWSQIEGTKPYDIRAASGSSNVTVNGFSKEVFKNERDLRNDFQSLPTTKAYREVQTSFDQINYALNNPSAANDLTAATKFMKMLDPGSVVRESELGMAMAATGQLDRMSNYYNMLKTGQKLTPSQRTDFHNSANGLYQAATERYNQSATEYRTMAQDYQLNPDRIAKPASADKTAKPAPAQPSASFDLPPNAKQYDGKTLRDTKSGKRFKSVNGKWQVVK